MYADCGHAQVPIGEPKELPPDWQGLEPGQHGPELSIEEQERAIEVLEGYTQVSHQFVYLV
jgi:hypothetical protein